MFIERNFFLVASQPVKVNAATYGPDPITITRFHCRTTVTTRTTESPNAIVLFCMYCISLSRIIPCNVCIFIMIGLALELCVARDVRMLNVVVPTAILFSELISLKRILNIYCLIQKLD